MEIEEALKESREKAIEARDKLKIEREEFLAKFDNAMEEVDAEVFGIDLALARISGREREPEKDWSARQRTASVLEMMGIAAREIGPAELAKMLSQVGRTETTDDVSQSLQYLKNKEPPLVTNLGRNRWILTPPPENKTTERG